MQALDQTQLNADIAAIQILHGRLGLDLSKSLAYHSGNNTYLRELNKRNILVSKYMDILSRYQVIGDTITTEHYNVLTVEDLQAVIDDAYRELERHNT